MPDDGRHTAHDDEPSTPTGSAAGVTVDGTDPDIADTRATRRDLKTLSAPERSRLFADVSPEPGSAKPDPIIVVDNISRTFGGIKAVQVDHLEVQRGAITGLIGPNGAGKTTFFNLITGFDKPDSGTWSLNGESLGRMVPHQVARRGMVRTFQLTKALSKLSVLDNVKLGATGQRGEHFLAALAPWTWRKQEAEITERAHELLRRFKLDAKAGDFAGSLSGGQRKLLEMARALMTDPEIVMLDEPMAGVNPALTQSLLEHIKSLRDEGVTVVFVEHDMDVIRNISDWVVVMAQGQIIAESLPDRLGDNEAVVDAYLGGHHDQALEFDDRGQPVGATAVLAEKVEAAIEATLEVGGDLSEVTELPPTIADEKEAQ
ncbi:MULTISPECIES: ABC transporter ATP-binding protein [Gordonia]|uniref:ABC transporter ATP-binding protein n=1 Tax=Gordonia amicalis TaxID=89053 RepID=A0AAE4U1Q1_9ACTN|nr:MULTISPECIES: ABC transporter ATP-binding protein [Gordonia]MCR8899204.1 ABC transporter ATP-binding protein [Gordonia sp. GONU]MCZ0912687.1 ABC transporter ATP-binding protein [Gordonia amicalis]MCZ4580583.1 ABC transporter ATP-binding protein [Gordonia amicalis]MCZ4652182.1 ABC transporter ATP-binding protein [Gordonia amicalis]MDJ0453710.1 ABC transporter ATP-binding protein [Gordonia amicalis]